MKPIHPPLLSTVDLRRIAIAALVDPRTLARVLRGEPVRPMCRERILQALAAQGLMALVPLANIASDAIDSTPVSTSIPQK